MKAATCVVWLVSGVAVATAIFYPILNLGKQNMMNICIYSVDPTKYMPKCFLCPTNNYSPVLLTCVKAAAIPSNITYTQASCIEQNCAIQRGKRSIDFGGADDNLFQRNMPEDQPLFDGSQLHQLSNPTLSEDTLKKLKERNIEIVGEAESYAMNLDNEELLLEYENNEEDGKAPDSSNGDLVPGVA